MTKIHRLPPMTKANRDLIRDGMKTETRRLSGLDRVNEDPDLWTYEGPKVWFGSNSFCFASKGKRVYVRCPYPPPGSLCVMREPLAAEPEPFVGFRYATYEDDGLPVYDERGDLVPWRWNKKKLSQLHMPTIYGRRYVRITEREPQRLEDITTEQAIAEGVEDLGIPFHSSLIKGDTLYRDYGVKPEDNDGHYYCMTAYGSYMTLFASIYGYEITNKNPWTWRLAWEPVAEEGVGR